MKYLGFIVLLSILISIAEQSNCMYGVASIKVGDSLEEEALKEIAYLKALTQLNFDELSFGLLAEKLKGSYFCRYIDEDNCFARDSDKIEHALGMTLALLDLMGEKGLLHVLENSELTTNCDSHQLRTKLSLLSKLKLQEIRYFLMKQGKFQQLQEIPHIESYKVYMIKDSVVFWDPDIEKEHIRFVLLIKNQLQEVIRMVVFLAGRVGVFGVKAKSGSQAQAREIDQLKRESKSKLLSVLTFLTSKAVEFLNETTRTNIETVVNRFGALQELAKHDDKAPGSEAAILNARDALCRSLSPIADIVGCLKAYAKLEYVPMNRVPLNIVHYVFSELLDVPQKPLIEEGLRLCERNPNLAQTFKDTLHDYVIEAHNDNNDRRLSAKGRMWEMVVAVFLMKVGTDKNSFGCVLNLNEHVKLHGKSFSREFDVVTGKLLCECKCVDWDRLSPERKDKLADQIKDQAKIAGSKPGPIKFLVISKEPISEEFEQIFQRSRIQYVDPRNPGDFRELYSNTQYAI